MIITKDIELKVDTPYMLRSDGQLVDCGHQHPYIKYDIQDSDENQIRDLMHNQPQWLRWYFNHTDHLIVKFYVHDFLSGIFLNNEHYKIKESAINYFLDIWELDRENAVYFSIEQTNKIFKWLNNAMNAEFARLIVQNIYSKHDNRHLHCRIGDSDFINSGMWIKYLRAIVKEHLKDIDRVTVVTDVKSMSGNLMYYRLNDKDINCMPVEEFIGP